ncbi:hypothetical protein DLM78_23520 [Leptospira stimsonii]|uniref:Uncharacterized protein n=1 Tax=Leptospira stimsonii TaxID=2202203 RepID=A0A8B3CK18_9LEPT|nr:hypothetical protein DLM78_23520 [Leptospira stimsonii]
MQNTNWKEQTSKIVACMFEKCEEIRSLLKFGSEILKTLLVFSDFFARDMKKFECFEKCS